MNYSIYSAETSVTRSLVSAAWAGGGVAMQPAGKQLSKTDKSLGVWGRTLLAGPGNKQGHHFHFPISKCGSWTASREVMRDWLHQKSLPTDSKPECFLHQGSGCSGKPPESADTTLIRKHCGKVELTQLEENSD